MQHGQRASFACTALVGSNKAGILKPTEDGYYTVVLGALNVFNSAGAFYPFEAAKQLFQESSSLMRRIANGACRGEYGHPRQGAMNTREFMGRVMDIYEPNVCCHFRKVWIDYNGVRDERGRPVIAVMGEVKPVGPMGAALKAALDNPSENVCFSVRSITNDYPINGVTQKNIRSIITWDYVNEPGISVAKKWHSPALESFEEHRVIPAHFAAMRNAQRVAGHGLSMESSDAVSVESVIADLGWDETALESDGGMGDGIVLDPRPASARW